MVDNFWILLDIYFLGGEVSSLPTLRDLVHDLEFDLEEECVGVLPLVDVLDGVFSLGYTGRLSPYCV